GRVESGGFSRAGRADDQTDSVRLLHDRFEVRQVLFAEAHFVERERLRAREDTHDDVFVLIRSRDRRDAELDDALRPFESDLSVLRLAALGNVERRHDFQALYQRVAVDARDLHELHAIAVDAQTDAARILRSV